MKRVLIKCGWLVTLDAAIGDFKGGEILYRGNTIQQAFLDIHCARAHVANNPYPYGRNLGAVRFGFDNASLDV